jgi:hypothetical protein
MLGFGLAGFGLPAVLVGSVLVIAIAALILHLLFPPAKSTQPRRAALPNVPRRCPACQEEMGQVERRGVQMETCPRCHGVWLSPGKLDQMIG